MADFKSMMNNRKSMFENAQKEIEKLSSKMTFEKDPRFWEPTLDSAKNGSAIMRFLPPKDKDKPFVKTYSYSFKGPTGLWYIEESPFTIGMPCPVYEYNNTLFKSGIPSDKKKVKPRKILFISNVLIVKDPGNPENNGKVFLFKYGKQIMKKLEDAINPDKTLDITPINPFDPIEGANFRFRRRITDNSDFPNYDLSSFDNVSSMGDEDYIEEIWNKEYSLLEFTAPERFKSYADLKAKFLKVMGYVEKGHIPDEIEMLSQKTEEEIPMAEPDDSDEDLAHFKSLLTD